MMAIAALLATAVLALAQVDAAPVVLSNGVVSATFDSATLQLLVLDKPMPTPSPLARPAGPWWSLALLSATGPLTLTSADAAAKTDYKDEMNLDTKSFDLHLHYMFDRPVPLQVAILLRLPFSDPVIHVSSFSVNSTVMDLALMTYTFSIDNISVSGPMSILFPTGFGRLIDVPSAKSIEFQGDYPSSDCAFQMQAVLGKSSGVYVASHDVTASTKALSYKTSRGHVLLSVTINAPNAGLRGQLTGRGVVPDFVPFAFGAVNSGDWWDAAMLYRSWVIDNYVFWTAGGPISRRVPAKMLANNVWVNSGWQEHDVFNTTQGDPDVVLQRVPAIRRRFNLDSLYLHWYEWDVIKFDTHYPEYFPPKAGFAAAVQTLQADGVRVAPYINGRIFDVNTTTWSRDHAAAQACKFPAHDVLDNEPLSLYQESYGSGATFAVMCPATSYWQTVISDVAETLKKQYGLDGVYIDQIGAAPPALCFDKTHNHPLAGGNHWVSGYRTFLQQVRSKTSEDFTVVTESNAEPYMSSLHAYLSLVAYYCDLAPALGGDSKYFVPAFPAIYGGYYLSFGAEFYVSDLKPNPDVFAAKLAKMFLSGTQLGWFSLGGTSDDSPMGLYDYFMNATYDPEVKFVTRLASFRSHASLFLVDGRLVRDLPIQSPVNYAPHAERINATGQISRMGLNYRSIDSSAWISADGTRLGIFIVNVTPQPHSSVALDIHLDRYGFQFYAATPTFTATQVHEDGSRTPLSTFNGWRYTYSGSLAGRDVLYLIIQKVH